MKKLLLTCVVLCGFASPAVAADIPVLPSYQPALVRPLYSWTGCYVGVNIGGGASPHTFVDTAGTFAAVGASLGDHTSRGVVGGGQLGCDYQVGSLVFGLRGLYDLSGMKASNAQPNVLFWNYSFVQSVAMLTGRVGYTVTPTLLVYANAGGAWAHDLYNVSTPPGTAVPIFAGTMIVAPGPGPGVILLAPGTIVALGSRTLGGWTLGAGLEWAFFGGNWSAFLEYDYVHLGSSQVTYTSAVAAGRTFPIDIGQQVHTVLFGINYRFWGGPSRF
jgi:outer membrane immunogenic protein